MTQRIDKKMSAAATTDAAAVAGLVDEDDAPPDLRFPCQVMGIDFHPEQDVLAAGLVSGKVELCVPTAEGLQT